MRVYLAGPITGASYEQAVDWRRQAEGLFADHITPISPMREKEYLSNEQEIAGSYEDSLFSNAATFTLRDVYDVRRAEALLVNVVGAERLSVGTVLEIGYACALNKPIVLVIDDGNIHAHPMLTEMVRCKVKTLEDGVAVINWLMGVGV